MPRKPKPGRPKGPKRVTRPIRIMPSALTLYLRRAKAEKLPLGAYLEKHAPATLEMSPEEKPFIAEPELQPETPTP